MVVRMFVIFFFCWPLVCSTVPKVCRKTTSHGIGPSEDSKVYKHVISISACWEPLDSKKQKQLKNELQKHFLAPNF